jgi:hypothetical protein
MITTSSSILQLIETLAVASLFALGVAACGSNPAPLGESQQPISDDGSEETGDDAGRRRTVHAHGAWPVLREP